ncbi:MAG: hypothetical protein P1V18_06055 [Candidatus Gracilibacteria bacterium]|nr:hypothetical protein [Candidatus Gracilibacteria bacterium]
MVLKSVVIVPQQYAQVKINLSHSLKALLKPQADRFRFSVSAYTKLLIANEVKQANMPLMGARKRFLESEKESLDDKDQIVLESHGDIDTFFDDL